MINNDTDVSLPVRSDAGKAALDIFYAEFNSVNFYVEDIDQENLYEQIFKTIFTDLKFSRVFPLGGKKSVLAHADDPTNKALISNTVYILDKDFDDLLGTIKDDPRIFYLQKFCIENHLIDEVAIGKVVIETFPKKKIAEIAEKLDLNVKNVHIQESLLPLFRLFYCAQRVELGLKNCKSKAEEFSIQKKPWCIDPDKIFQYSEKLQSIADQNQKTELLSQTLQITAPIFSIDKADELISGKFHLAMLFHFVKSIYPLGSITFDSFVFRVAKNSEMTSLRPLAENVSNYLAKLQEAA